jgi:multiple sugar transport system substrate-binding protein
MCRVARSLLILLLSCCLIGLAGCQAAPEAQSGVIHLTLWHGVNPPSNRDVLQRLVDQFNQTHPTIQVEPLYVGQADQQMPKILSAVVGNVPPHLLWYAPTITGQLVELDAIVPLDDRLTTNPVFEQIDPTLIETLTWDGHIWSVPFSVNNVGIFYRPSLFDAAGITQIPKTWDDLRQVARQLTRPENKQHGMLLPLGKGEWSVFMWLPFMWSSGGELIDPQLGDAANGQAGESASASVQLVNQGAIAALQFWQDLIQDGSAVLSQPERGYELDQFLAGTVAMQLTGPWTLGQLQASGVDFAVMPIPIAQRPATSIGGENLFIFNTTPEAEQAALTFADYVLSEAFQTDWAIATGYLPVNLKARQSAAYQQFLAQQPAVSVFLQQAQFGRSRPIAPGYSRISDQLGRAIEATLLGKRTPTEALQAAQKRLDQVISN